MTQSERKLPTITQEQRDNLTWECKAGETGEYLGTPVAYQGCGVMAPREVFGCISRRSCACELAAREAERREADARERNAVLKRMTYTWLGEQWSDSALAHKTYANFVPHRQPAAFKAVRLFAKYLEGTLILYGTYGTGKTHLLAALCNDLRTREKPIESRFTAAPALFHAIQESIGHNESYMPLIQIAIKTPLLVLDDIDKAKWTEFREEIYFDIIDGRTKAGRPIAISTNRMGDLAQFVGGACASRLKIGQMAIEMTGVDYRELL